MCLTKILGTTRRDRRRRRIDQTQSQRIEYQISIQLIRRQRRDHRGGRCVVASKERRFGAYEGGGGDEDSVIVVCEGC